MASSVIQYIDNLIENALTNMDSQSTFTTSGKDVFSMVDTEITKPIYDFLTGEEKKEKDSISYNNRVKSLEKDNTKKRVKDNEINASKNAIQIISKLKTDLDAKKEELRRLQMIQQMKQKEQMDNIDNQNGNNDSDSMQESSFILPDDNIKKYDALPIIKRAGINSNQIDEVAPLQVQKTPAPISSVQPVKVLKVNFDSHSPNPYQVSFSERGFLIGDTRLSFEIIETALSKNFTITLKDGFVLDAIKMQKIMRYKNRV